MLECGRDWFEMYARQVHRDLPGRWASVIDEDRVRDGSHRRVEPRLGMVKPEFQEPAWGPHISTIRGFERVTTHLDLWDLGVELGDVRQEIVSMVESRKHFEAKAAIQQNDLASMRPGVRPKFRKQHEDALEDSLAKVRGRTTRLGRLEGDEARLVRRVERLVEAQDLPDYVLPGAKIQFGFDPDLKLVRSHWFFDVKCRTLGRVRAFFNLPARCRVPLHLTVAVTSGA